jgi:hypothetical protein
LASIWRVTSCGYALTPSAATPWSAAATTIAGARPPREAAPARIAARRRQLAWAGALLMLALGARVLLEIDAASFHLWLGTSSAAFLGSMSLGGVLAVPRGAQARGPHRR